jgi:hypothetical protein
MDFVRGTIAAIRDPMNPNLFAMIVQARPAVPAVDEQ